MKNQQLLVGIIHELNMGGAERMMVNILNHFSSKGKNVHLVIFANNGVLKELLNPRIIVHDLQTASVSKGMMSCLKTLRIIKPDTVFSGIGHVNIALSPFIPLMRKFLPETRWIARETNIASLQNQESKHPNVFNYLYKKTYHYFDVIIAQSLDMQDDLNLHYPLAGEKSVLINNPIDIEKVQKLAKEEIDLKVTPTAINLVNVGTLRETKRHDLLLQCMAQLPSNYHLLIVGSGKEEMKLKKMSHDLGLDHRVVFAGHQTNPYPFIQQADLFVFTSEHEGFPNVFLEANSLGLAVIAFDAPGGINEIIDNGLNGEVVPFANIDAMVSTIENSIGEGFDKEKILDSVERRYTHEIILAKYEKVFYGEEEFSQKGLNHAS